jgi:tRNA (guanine-N7-)-methyltransferase
VVSRTGEPALSAPAAGASFDPVLEPEALQGGDLELRLGPAPRVLEIGFGRGELLLASASEQPGRCFLGVEVSRKRVEKMARRVVRAQVRNLRLVRARAEELLERVLPDAAFAVCWVHCPDPWPKKRHHRRRFFQPSAVAGLARVLEPGALLHVSTDHLEYARWIAEVLAAAPELENLCAPEPWTSQRPAERGATAYESEWLAEGRALVYFRYRRS